MLNESLQAAEKECAEGRTAPRISLNDIVGAIRDTHYTTADLALGIVDWDLAILTLCILKMKNGFIVIGKSAPMSRENFNAELGKKLAYEDCVRQLWPLMAFAAKEKVNA